MAIRYVSGNLTGTVIWVGFSSIPIPSPTMLPIFVFIALPTLSLALVIAIICRRLSTSGLRHRSSEMVRRAMSRLEAMQMLGLEDDSDRNAIRRAYMSLMIQYHPDHGGSHNAAARLNLARDTLLRKKRSFAA